MSISSASIEISQLALTLGGKRLMEDFTASIRAGEKVCIMGPSGTGKSSLLLALLGLVQPERGRIEIEGIELNVSHLALIRQCFAWVPQNLATPYETAREMITCPLSWAVNAHVRFDEALCLERMEQLGLVSSLLDAPLQQLSGGEAQRVAIIAALTLNRRILLLDEPSSALDAENSARLSSLLHSLHDCTVLAVTHDQALAQSMDRIITLVPLI